MSSFDKVVKLACKPKAAPPKAKYLDPIIAATWSEDGAVHDVCKALSPRFREPNAIVVFKALIVLHTMIRNGATDNVLSYLCASEVLRLRNVSSGNWEGYSAPENLQNYAKYLDTRIRAYRDLKHDAIRVQAETNRDMRFNTPMDDEATAVMSRTRVGKSMAKPTPAPTRSKTMMGRKLRSMTVEKGLLRETKAVHKQIDALVECRFYLDDLEDELNTTALRMLVKDLLILFQAGNEGVINVLEHYFEMSHTDAEEALAIYLHFCSQTEKVVEYLGVARKLQNILNVPIPNLKHAPVSLAGALQEYLDDPNFEQNRIEYRANKEATDGGSRKSSANGNSGSQKAAQSAVPPVPALPTNVASQSSNAFTSTPDTVGDFFNSIEEVQPTTFNPQSNGAPNNYFPQQGNINPFHQIQMQSQPTGFGVISQQTGFVGGGPSNPFGAQQQQPSHLRPQGPNGPASGHRPFTSFIPSDSTGMGNLQAQMTGAGAFNMQQQQPQAGGYMQAPQAGMLQPQVTGSNPFRASMMLPQTTGQAMFGTGGLQPQYTATPFGQQQQQQQMGMGSMMNGGGFMGAPQQPQSATFQSSPSPFDQNRNTITDVPPRPSSVPLSSFGSTSLGGRGPSPPPAQPVKTHQTGTRNPFGPVSVPAPPVPKAPTLMEIAMGYGRPQHIPNQSNGNPQQQQSQPTGMNGGIYSFSSSALNPGATDMASVASSFNKPAEKQNDFSSSSFLSSQNTSTTTTSSNMSDSLFSQQTGISSQPTGISQQQTGTQFQSLKPQMTGFSGLKAFKPSSSFGASLMESLPPIPGSAPATPAGAGSELGSQPSGGFGGGSALGQGLRPQMTGGPNPFRASMMPNFGSSPMNGTFPGNNASSGTFGSPSGAFGQNQQQQPQSNGNASWL